MRFIGEQGSLSNFCWLAHHWQQVHRYSMWRFHLFISAGELHDACLQMSTNIRCTIGSPQRDLIKHIAPTIARMHIAFPLCMSLMFSHVLIEKFSVSKNIDCTDLMASDRFFDAIIQKCVMTLRYSDNKCWPTIIPKLICTTTPKWKCLGGMCFTCTCLRRESSYAKFQSSRVSGCMLSL